MYTDEHVERAARHIHAEFAVDPDVDKPWGMLRVQEQNHWRDVAREWLQATFGEKDEPEFDPREGERKVTANLIEALFDIIKFNGLTLPPGMEIGLVDYEIDRLREGHEEP